MVNFGFTQILINNMLRSWHFRYLADHFFGHFCIIG